MNDRIELVPNVEGWAVMAEGREAFRVVCGSGAGYEVYDLRHEGEITGPSAYFTSLLDVRNAMALVMAS